MTYAAYRAITKGNPPHVDLRLERVAAGEAGRGSIPPNETAWLLEELGLCNGDAADVLLGTRAGAVNRLARATNQAMRCTDH